MSRLPASGLDKNHEKFKHLHKLQAEKVLLHSIQYTVKNVDFTVIFLASGCQFFYRYLYGRLPVEHF